MAFMCIALIFSIITIVQDEADHVKEKEDLTSQLNSMKDSLSTIRKIGSDLHNQIEPILNLARKKYPDLPIEDAIIKIQHELDSLEVKASYLEDKEEKRMQNERELAILKKNKPDVNFKLGIINKKVRLWVEFKNRVPIEFRPYLSLINDEEGKNYKKDGSVLIMDYQKVYPNDIDKNQSYFDFFDLSSYELPKNTTYLFKVFVRYRSVFAEVSSTELKEVTVELNYIFNPVDGTMKPWVQG